MYNQSEAWRSDETCSDPDSGLGTKFHTLSYPDYHFPKPGSSGVDQTRFENPTWLPPVVAVA